GVRVAELAKSVVGVLAGRGWRARIPRRRLGEGDGLTHQAEAADLGMLVLVHQVVVAYRRGLEEVKQGLHGRRRDVVGGQELEPLGAGLLAEPRLEDRQEVRVVLDAQEPGAEARIVGDALEAERLRELDPEGLIADREEEPLAVARLVEAVGRVVADQRGLARVVDGDTRLERQHAPQERGLDALAPPGALAREERREGGLGRQRGRVAAGRRRAGLLGRAAQALDRPWAAERLEDRIEARTLRAGAGGAERGDRAVDEARVERREPRPA